MKDNEALLERALNHWRTLPPHVRTRATGKLFHELIMALQEVERRITPDHRVFRDCPSLQAIILTES